MAVDETKHVFVSYVRDDSDEVDRLRAVLEAAQIPYWRDRTSLAPGDAWKAKTRHAIQGGSLVFLPCFSERSRSLDKSVMNEELTLAVDEFRKMPPGRTWLIPVRLDDGPVPDWDLGAGRVLSDLNYVDLFGDQYPIAAASLVTAIHNQIGERRTSAASALAAVDQVLDADRSALLVKMTKEMVLDRSRRIELDELVGQEVRRVLTAMEDPDAFPTSIAGTTNDERIAELVESARRYWQLLRM